MVTAPASARNAPSAAAPVVACQKLTKVFKDFWMRDRVRAVDELSFDIRPREVFGLLGPNGSGKSTTIKMILGLLRPSRGRLAVFGKPPHEVDIKKRIGYLPEESYLYPFLNARETLDYYAKLFNLDAKTRTRRTDELLDMVGLTGAQFRPVREYSKGMQRRIGIAQALINDPDFLILDEPTTGLDPIGTKQVKDLILELGRRGKTILLSSHLLSDVEDCVDRMVILYGGRVRAEGTCEQLLESQSKTSIEADTLDDATLAEIDRVIRARSGGHKSVLRVSRPRQRLEDLFLDIVERARSEQVSTSGATSGGQTAAFLRAGETGQSLIEKLVTASDAATAAKAAPTPTGPDDSLIGSLVSAAPNASSPAPSTPSAPSALSSASGGTPAEPRSPAAPPAPSNVDRSLIDSLLSGGDKPSDPKASEPKP
ncbi:MAG: ABC transporter ATP-binding protein [Phycisphaerales bacterium]|jgi:ABC-2 type transport system ATP-binding protein|nr:ABC transporter ATP-binding protein [Phycisphaerales bacterium]